MITHQKTISSENKATDQDWNAGHGFDLIEAKREVFEVTPVPQTVPTVVLSCPLSVGADQITPQTFLILAKTVINSPVDAEGSWGVSSMLMNGETPLDVSGSYGEGPGMVSSCDNMVLVTVQPGENITIDLMVALLNTSGNLIPNSTRMIVFRADNTVPPAD